MINDHDLALGYALGWQAAMGVVNPSAPSCFAAAFAARVEASQTGRAWMVTVGGAWQEWLSYERLTYGTPEGVQREIVIEWIVGAYRATDRVCEPVTTEARER